MRTITRRLPSLSVVAFALALPAGCLEGHPESEALGEARQPLTWVITVRSDGTFMPGGVNIHTGDTVEWHLYDDADSLIPVNWTGAWNPTGCDYVNRKAYSALDPNDLTGPMPDAPSGVFTLGPADTADDLAAYPAGTCPVGSSVVATGGGKDLCKGPGVDFASMLSTWTSPDIRGVMIRLLWKDLNTGPGVNDFDYTVLDREVDQAIAGGKLYSLAIKAGSDGTPDWIFSNGVKKLHLQDGGSGLTMGDCGSWMWLGDPTDPEYQTRYLAMLSAVSTHLKARADRYRALAYIKPSGANLFSHENRLPKRCKTNEGCVCNAEVLANSNHDGVAPITDGYRPLLLYAFYQAELDRLNLAFAGKAMGYALIQDGFPRVNKTGGYELFDGSSSDGNPLPGAFEQTQAILDLGQLFYPSRFVVAHNGLGPAPVAGTCPNYLSHPVPLHARIWYDVPGCPNSWALHEGAEGQITGFQTENASQVGTPTQLDATFQNAWDNSDAVYVEMYEQRLWEVANNGGTLPTSGKTIGQWSRDLQTRRPAPLIYKHTFTYTGSGGYQYLWYVHGKKCNAIGGSPTAYGVVAIIP